MQEQRRLWKQSQVVVAKRNGITKIRRPHHPPFSFCNRGGLSLLFSEKEVKHEQVTQPIMTYQRCERPPLIISRHDCFKYKKTGLTTMRFSENYCSQFQVGTSN